MESEVKKQVRKSLQEWQALDFEEKIKYIDRVHQKVKLVGVFHFAKYRSFAAAFLRVTKSFYESKDLF